MHRFKQKWRIERIGVIVIIPHVKSRELRLITKGLDIEELLRGGWESSNPVLPERFWHRAKNPR